MHIEFSKADPIKPESVVRIPKSGVVTNHQFNP